MNRMVSRLCACLVAFSLFAALCGGMVARAADGFDYNYTYTYDYWGDERQSPDAYRTSAHAVQRLPWAGNADAHPARADRLRQ